jgi:hypothetical protein
MKRILRVLTLFALSILIAAPASFAAGRRPAGLPPAAAETETPADAPPSPAADIASPAEVIAPAQPETSATIPSGPMPRIVFDSTTHDFGEALGVEKVEHVYRFRNEGRADLKIDKVSTTCGCTAALVSSKIVPPGGAGEIGATFTIGGRQGKQVKHIYVYSNDPAEPKVCLTIEGTVIPPLLVEPQTVILQDRPAESSKTVRISQTLPEELTLGEPATRLNLVTAALREEPPENGKRRYLLEVSLKADVETGRHFENVRIPTNSAAKPTLQIPVRITVSGEIAAQPSRISLGQLAPGQEVARSITVASTRDREFAVLKAEIDNPAFRISPQGPLESAKSRTFTVTGAPGSGPGGVRAKAVFTLDHPKQKTIEVPIYGWLRRSAPRAAQAPPPGGRIPSPSPAARP